MRFSAAFAKTLGAACLAAVAASAAAQTKLTIGYNSAPGNPRDTAARIFAKEVETLTQGSLQIQIAGNAQLGDDQAMLTGMRTGSIDISPNSQGVASSVVPDIAAFGMPFLFDSLEHAWRVVDDERVQAHLVKKFDEKGLVLLGFMDQGIRHVSNNKRPIRSLDDLKGLKLRTPPDPVTVDIFRELGADPQQLKFSELYVALQQGVVDGQENPLMNIDSSKLYEVQKYISITGHKWECIPFLVSKRTWGRLSDAQRQAMTQAAQTAIKAQRDLVKQSDVDLFEKLKKDGILFNELDVQPLRTASQAVVDKWLASDSGAFVRLVLDVAAAKR